VHIERAEEEASSLSHWPIQIRLILADCAAVAFPTLHRDLLKGKVVMMGCPKFDDTALYVEKFADIFRTADIKSVTTVVMEVPCCSGLPLIVRKGMDAAERSVPMQQIVLSLQGKILKRS
jgi:hypothetical protein